MKSEIPFQLMIRGDGRTKTLQADLSKAPFLFQIGGGQLPETFNPATASAVVDVQCSGFEVSAEMVEGVINFTFQKSSFSDDPENAAPEKDSTHWITGKLKF